MKKRIKLCAILLVLCVAVCLSLTGCPKACVPSILDFADEDFATLCGEIFDKDYKRVTAEDMASIESFGILTYGEDNTVSVGFTGSIENPTDTNTKVVDITGLIFDSFDDFAYLTNLRVFSSTYTTNNDYSFLANCKELEAITIYGNSECRGFDFLSELPKLGEQVVLMTPKAFEKIQFIEYEIADGSIYNQKRMAREDRARKTYLSEHGSDFEIGAEDLFVRDIISQKVKNNDPRL